MMQGPIRVFVSVWVSVVCVLGMAPCAFGDRYLEQANRAAAVTPGTKALEDVLFPALAAMDEPPSLTLSVEEMVILRESDSRWRELERWAMRDPQQAVIKALAEVGDPDQRFVLGIAYDSAQRASEEWRRAGLVNSIGRGGELGTVSFDYLDRMEWLLRLALVDSYRLAREGNGEASLDVLIDLIRLARILADRPSATEKQFAFVMARVGLERVRDVVYSHQSAFTAAILKDVISEFDDRAKTLNRISFPLFERLAAEQALARGFEERGGVRAEALAELLAKSATNMLPLRTFSEYAWYERLASQHEGWFETKDRIQAVWGDFEIRWNNQNWNEPTLRRVTEFEQTDPTRFSVVRRFGGIDAETDLYRFLSQIRFDTVTELRGTYNSLGVVAFRLENRAFPPVLAAIQPRYVPRLALDPYAWNERLRRQEDFGFFVPIRDQTFGPRELPRPYAVRVNLFENDSMQALPPVQEDVPRDAGMSMAAPPGAAGGGLGGMMGGFAGELPADAMENIPDDLIDEETGRLRIDVLRRWFLQNLDEAEFDRDLLGDMNQSLPMLAGMLGSPEMAREQANMVVSMLNADPAVRNALTGFGVDMSKVERLIPDLMADLARDASVQSAMEKARAGQALSDSDIRSMLRGMVNVVVQDRYIEPFQDLLVLFVSSEFPMGGIGEKAFFIAMVDDSQFLLYSLGPNRRNDLAAVVGAGGDDILIWPPISALRRANQ